MGGAGEVRGGRRHIEVTTTGNTVPSGTADVIVVGAGPAGAATALVCARAGLAVTWCEKSATWPRSKPCGDALTSRALGVLASLGVALPSVWARHDGLLAYGLDDSATWFPWPGTIPGLPDHGVLAPRAETDAVLAAAAVEAGARLVLGTAVRRLDLDERGHVRGVVTTDGRTIAGRVVVDAAGAASRLADQMGLPRRPDRPMGVAVRAYVRGTAGAPAVGRIHSWLAPHDAAGARLTGYGWLFPLGDGLFNVGVGQLSTSPSFRHTDYRALLRDFVAGLPADWDLRFVGEPVRSAGGALEAPDVDRPQIHGAGLPMGFDRVVAYRRGLLLTGDAAGLVNPFNGEGVSYALRSGQLAGEAIVDAFRTPGGVGSPAAEAALQGYHHALKAEVDPYFRLGRLFARLIAHPGVVEAGLAHVLPHQAPMDPVNKVMANLIPPRGGGVGDRTLRLAVRLSGAV